MCRKMQEEAEKGYLLPEEVPLEEFLSERDDLPEWFEHVFRT